MENPERNAEDYDVVHEESNEPKHIDPDSEWLLSWTIFNCFFKFPKEHFVLIKELL